MDLHRLAEERSLAYHQVIAARLEEDPALLVGAKKRVAAWMAAESPPFYAREWWQVLAGSHREVASFLVERNQLANELRQSSPFAGVLGARERWQIWRETRERFSAER